MLVFVFLLAPGQLEQNAGKEHYAERQTERERLMTSSRAMTVEETRYFYLILVICNSKFQLVFFFYAIRCDFTFKYDRGHVSLVSICTWLSHAANLHFFTTSGQVAIKIKSQSAIHNNNESNKSIQTPTTARRSRKIRAKNKQNT